MGIEVQGDADRRDPEGGRGQPRPGAAAHVPAEADIAPRVLFQQVDLAREVTGGGHACVNQQRLRQPR